MTGRAPHDLSCYRKVEGLYSALHSAPSGGGNVAVESVVTLPWTQRQVCDGLSGNVVVESVATFARNTQRGPAKNTCCGQWSGAWQYRGTSTTGHIVTEREEQMGERVKTTAKTPELQSYPSMQRKQSPAAANLIHSPAAQLLFLQRIVGNRAIERMMNSGALQAKLQLGQPGDRYEQEADRMAEQVMRIPELKASTGGPTAQPSPIPTIQRLCTECEEELQRQPMEAEEEEEETVQTKPLADHSTPLIQRQGGPTEEEEALQTKSLGTQSTVSPSLHQRITALHGSGQPLPQTERAFFEPRFGVDFSQVRIHATSHDSDTARTVSARAFTVGQHVVFETGYYQPGTSEGRRLLAHELTHVVQQSGGQVQRAKPQRREVAIQGDARSELAPEGIGTARGYGQSIGASAVPVEEAGRRGLGPAAVALQTGDVQGNPEKVRLNFLYSPLQRKCACGTHTCGGAECDVCRGEGQRLQRAAVNRVGDSEVQPELNARARSLHGFAHDFSRVSAASPERAATTVPAVGNSSMRSVVSHYRHNLSATVRRVRPQSDSTGDNAEQREPSAQQEMQEQQSPAVAPERTTRESKDGETVYFTEVPPVAAGASEDSISSNLTYTSPVTKVNPPQSPGQFGKTQPIIAVNRSSATTENKVFKVELVIDNKISYWVDSGNRTDIASDSDPRITQTNYSTVVSDLTPSPTAVKNATTNLYKNQPPRTQFWAEDLTLKHERFHAAEDVKFGKQGAIIGHDWLNTQTASKMDDIGPMLHTVAKKVAAKIDQEMAVPGSENRAYDDGAPDYTARATAIKTKGDAIGYAAKPPAAPQTPNSPPTPSAPKTPNSPPSPTPKGFGTPPRPREEGEPPPK
jgi:hypothetical protein